MGFIKKDQTPQHPLKLEVPKPVMAVPIQGETLPGPDGRSIGVIVGFGWIANDDKTPTMRPVVLAVVKGGAIVAFPAEFANVVESEEPSALVTP